MHQCQSLSMCMLCKHACAFLKMLRAYMCIRVCSVCQCMHECMCVYAYVCPYVHIRGPHGPAPLPARPRPLDPNLSKFLQWLQQGLALVPGPVKAGGVPYIQGAVLGWGAQEPGPAGLGRSCLPVTSRQQPFSRPGASRKFWAERPFCARGGAGGLSRGRVGVRGSPLPIWSHHHRWPWALGKARNSRMCHPARPQRPCAGNNLCLHS